MNIFKKVMSLINKLQQNPQSPETESIFTKEEIEFLLITLKDSTFRGSQLEVVYNTVVKLQQEYSKVNKS
jgi:hypothetical protein